MTALETDPVASAWRVPAAWRPAAVVCLLLLMPLPSTGLGNTASTGGSTTVATAGADPDVADRQRLLLEIANTNAEDEAPMPERPDVHAIPLGNEAEAHYQRAWVAYYEYIEQGYAFRQQVYAWQDLSTKVIFCMVIFLVLLGMYFAAMQFHAGLLATAPDRPTTEPERVSADAPADAPTENATGRRASLLGLMGFRSDLEISKDGIKISSPVLGVVILVISLAFFYLYLIYVYPINDSF